MRLIASPVLLILAAACATAPPPPPAAASVPNPEPVRLLRADGEVPRAALLDVTIVAFDPGLGEGAVLDPRRHVYPRLREVEARYLPHVLRDTLRWTNQWGAVRVLPEADPTAELLITGTILASTGTRLELAVRAVDSSGRVWIDAIYGTPPRPSAYAVERGPVPEPFQDLYNRIANDLLAVRRTLGERDLQRIQEIAELRYAAALAPQVFDDYLRSNPDGSITVNRLPARGDALLQRILRVRDAEYLYIDTVDEHYREIGNQSRRPYYFWRRYSYESIAGLAAYRDAAEGEHRGDRRSYWEMRDRYFEFRELKLQQETLRELADSLDREVTPTVFEIEGTVLELSGTLEEQYAEWRQLLREIHAEETGLPAVDR